MVMTSYNHFYEGAGTQAGWDQMTNYQLTLNASYDFFDYKTSLPWSETLYSNIFDTR